LGGVVREEKRLQFIREHSRGQEKRVSMVRGIGAGSNLPDRRSEDPSEEVSGAWKRRKREPLRRENHHYADVFLY